jgi:replication factor A2
MSGFQSYSAAFSGGDQSGQSSFAPSGGFSPSQGNSSASKYGASPASESKFGSNTEKQTLMPVNAQIFNNMLEPSKRQAFKYMGIDVHKVTMVGVIKGVDMGNVHSTLMVEDGSGVVRVRMHHENDGQLSSQYRENVYVRVIGKAVTLEEGARFLQAYGLKLVMDFNEVTYHMLATIKNHLVVTKPKPQSAQSGNVKTQPSFNANSSNNVDVTSGIINQNGFASGSAPANKGQSAEEAIMNVFNKDTTASGLKVPDVRAALPHLSVDVIRQTIEDLNDEGHLYSTIASDIWKSVEV